MSIFQSLPGPFDPIGYDETCQLKTSNNNLTQAEIYKRSYNRCCDVRTSVNNNLFYLDKYEKVGGLCTNSNSNETGSNNIETFADPADESNKFPIVISEPSTSPTTSSPSTSTSPTTSTSSSTTSTTSTTSTSPSTSTPQMTTSQIAISKFLTKVPSKFLSKSKPSTINKSSTLSTLSTTLPKEDGKENVKENTKGEIKHTKGKGTKRKKRNQRYYDDDEYDQYYDYDLSYFPYYFPQQPLPDYIPYEIPPTYPLQPIYPVHPTYQYDNPHVSRQSNKIQSQVSRDEDNLIMYLMAICFVFLIVMAYYLWR